MQYYIFKEACATKETGPVYPQIQKWKPGYDDDRLNSYFSYYLASKQGEFPDFTPDLDSLIMHGKAKPTDIVSSIISIGFVVSKKLKEVFEHFAFPPHRFYPAKLMHKNAGFDYYFMHIISDYTDFVDFGKSTFITCGFSNSDPQPITLTSKQDYINKAKQLQDDSFVKQLTYRSIQAKEIHFNGEFNKQIDFFQINRFDINFCISQRLKDAITENAITGCDIQPTNRIII